MARLCASLAAALFAVALAVPAGGHGPASHGEAPRRPGSEEDAMKAQHERMERFRDAARALNDALLAGDRKGAGEAAGTLARALAGHENDVPHKNRSRSKEYHALFVKLGKRTEALRGSLSAGTFPQAAAAYGRVLETCVACHVKFRD